MSSPTERIAQLEATVAELQAAQAAQAAPARATAPAASRLPRRMPPMRRFLVLGLAIALLIPAGGALASHQFSDVPTSYQFHNSIDAIADAGITTGCGGGKYCPNGLVTRGQMAAFLNRLGALSPGSQPKVNADKLDGLNSTDFLRPHHAQVQANGTLSWHSGAVSSSRAGVGLYEVVFNRNISTCAASVTPGNLSVLIPSSGMGSAALRLGNNNAAWVELRDTAGALADRPFMISVFCGPITIAFPFSVDEAAADSEGSGQAPPTTTQP